MLTISDRMARRAVEGALTLGSARMTGVRRFVQSKYNADGGFQGRSPDSDVYYSAFGIEILAALPGTGIPRQAALRGFLERQQPAELDPIHLACLARLWSRFSSGHVPAAVREAILARLEIFACPTGGCRIALSEPHASPYGCFLLYKALEDLGVEPAPPMALLKACEPCRTPDGAYSNETDMEDGQTPATAGAVVLALSAGLPPDSRAVRWLEAQCEDSGGFLAFPGCPVADLLSTATALFALETAGALSAAIAPTVRFFIDGLLLPDGGFAGHLFDDTADLEYTFYGLVALGCLAAADIGENRNHGAAGRH